MTGILLMMLAVPAVEGSVLEGVLKKPELPKKFSRPRQALLRGPLHLGDGTFVVEFADEYVRSETKERKDFLREKTAEYKKRSVEDFPVYGFMANKTLWTVAVGARPRLVRIILESEKLEMMGDANGYSETFSPEELLFLARGAYEGDDAGSRAGSVKLLGETLQKFYWDAQTLPKPLKERLWDFVLSAESAADSRK